MKTNPLDLINFIKDANGLTVFSAEIRDHFNIKERPGDNTNAQTRLLIRKALKQAMELRIPIGSHGKGYFLIRTQAEMDAFIKNMEARVRGIIARKQQVINAYQKCEIREVNLTEIF